MRDSSSPSDRPPYTSGSRRPRTLRLTPFRTRIRIARTLSPDQFVERAAHVGLGKLGLEGTVVAEEDHAQRPLLVAPERLPRARLVHAHGLWAKHVLDRVGRPAREPQRRHEAERD